MLSSVLPIEPTGIGTVSIHYGILSIRWFGKCWHIHNMLKYEFDIEFDVRSSVSNETFYYFVSR